MVGEEEVQMPKSISSSAEEHVERRRERVKAARGRTVRGGETQPLTGEIPPERDKNPFFS